MKFIMLRLEGPIQSWGERSLWDERDTSDKPTKSGIVGLIACCMGLSRENETIPKIYDEISMSVRIDNRGRIARDFQTIENTVKADGKLNKNKVVSPRYYLTDASFLVAIGFKDELLLNEIVSALKTPKWLPYLGRKSCIPVLPIYAGIVDAETPLEALCKKDYPVRYQEKLAEYIEFNIEGYGADDKISYRKRDIYGTNRFFRYRYVYEDYVASDKLSSINVLKEAE
jgi:CRISPR system Cascade subunit CasD